MKPLGHDLLLPRRNHERPDQDLSQLIEETIRLLEPEIQAKALRVEKTIPPGVTANLDVDRFRQALINVLLNAVDATPAGSVLRIDLTEPFYSSKPGGTGLGLAISRELIHGRRPHLQRQRNERSAGGGVLIVAAARSGRLNQDSHHPDCRRRGDSAGGVGLVDCRRRLHVITAAKGTETIGRILRERPSVALVDIRMPEMDGLTVLKQARSDGSRTAFIAMTAFGDSNTAIEAMKLGAFDYLTKPVIFEDVLRLIRRPCRPAESPRPAAVEGATAAIVVGRSAAMQTVYKLIGQVAASDATVLVRGESGTGKELVVDAIHVNSSRALGRSSR